ncbi:sperm-tail PG-rich repeat-containing protein 2 [Cavia porcellus]|uniref:sperm-tail PG-rich repeat-containing protein 2 n=1 Tax=Cavia porcellus TaxID=10141 RepID=UPI002FDF5000
MYDRTPRWLPLAVCGGTEERVGPGSYQVAFPQRRAADGYAPFLSLAARESTFAVVSNIENDVPGPGHYNVSEAQCNIKGGQSLQNREQRFKKFISDNPGPASYYCGTLDILKKKILESKVCPQSKISRTPTVTRNVDVPSIPSCGQSYGYHIHEDDKITKCFPPASDNTLGPAYYKLQFDVSIATLKYKGVHFGSSPGRQELPKTSGPGPGQYEVVTKKILRCENINTKKGQQQSYYSYIPRFFEVIELQEEKKGVPGPGKYDIRSQFQMTEGITPNVTGASPAFLSQSQRFVPVKSITPAPGTYNEPRTAFKTSKKTSGLKNTPFGQSAARFTQDSRAEEMPGPGFYNILNNNIVASIRDNSLKQPEKSAFGSSVSRTLVLVQNKAYTSPGPSDYQHVFWNSQDGGIPGKKKLLHKLTKRRATNLARTERTRKVPAMVFPAPGSYDVQKSYERSQVQHKYMPPRSPMAERKHCSFLSAAPRCPEKVPDGPGPAAYNPVFKKSCPIPLCFKASKRFENSKEVTPGPATYELSPFLRHSVLKRTFNVTLLNPLITKTENIIEQKAKSRHPGGKTQASKQCSPEVISINIWGS